MPIDLTDPHRYDEFLKEHKMNVEKMEAAYRAMPSYTCHKRVKALEIEKVGSYCQATEGLMRNIWFVGDDHWELFPDKMFTRYVPIPGDFYVVYEDGYQSFSPRKAFLEGYTLDAAPDQA